MSEGGGSQFISVRTELVLQELVEDMASEASARAAKPLDTGIEESLQAASTVLNADAPLEDAAREALARLARSGWYARLRELERFEVARRSSPPELAEALREGDWAAAVATCVDLAVHEPLKRPAPDDPAAASWRVPGPGGHVRHYVALRAIGDSPEAVDAAAALGHADPTPLKRVWLFGFLLAEALRERSEPA